MTSVKAIAITHPVISDVSNPAELLSYVARVSNPKNQMNMETAPKLLKYCLRKKHWSVFEHVYITMEIECPRDIGRQILRHRSFTFSEWSQRYSDPTKDLGFVLRDARLQDYSDRQNSIETDDSDLQQKWLEVQQNIIDESKKAYDWAISNGIAKEQARVVLPEGNTVTKLFFTGSLRSFIHYCQLRGGNGTQAEHREIAKMAWSQIVWLIPIMAEIDIFEEPESTKSAPAEESNDWFSRLRRQFYRFLNQ